MAGAILPTTKLPPGFTPIVQLGKGAYGQVWQAKDSNGKLMAVKVISLPKAREMAKQETEALSSLAGSSNVLGFVGEFHDEDTTYLITEYAGGGDLLKLMQERKCQPMSEDEARHYFRQLLSTLDYIHKQGWVHRDIKCENVLLSSDRNRIILADFGFATRWSTDQFLEEAFGSLHYSAPEICNGVRYRGPEVDVWSVGVVLYALCSGRLPFGGSNEEEIVAGIRCGECLTPRGISSALQSLLRSLMNPNSNERATIASVKMHPWLKDQAPAASIVPRIASAPAGFSPRAVATQRRRPSLQEMSQKRNTTDERDKEDLRRQIAALNIDARVVTPMSQPHDNGEASLLTKLSRFTNSGLKRFSLSRLAKKN